MSTKKYPLQDDLLLPKCSTILLKTEELVYDISMTIYHNYAQ